ncbi:5'/3'-nucleotidase SurE [Catenovulum sp. SM1970]|uniref:5'/3'-nucleotidase SurE n=1 Tax=Marinifaba aquimaris TaxID=2741323 RepID=UPI001572499D|nr:5'/3'-nucleotidase SurE [Marinifaba aquimaris]NTS78058.1 5'/3'-nucleotidase SurE [Marinifaba aquimaris]
MRILLSNDDGVNATGIRTLFAELKQDHHVDLIAPDRNCSGASSSLTLVNPLRANEIEPHIHSVNGTPTDCVHIGINQFLVSEPDIVIAGINHGGNLGDDVVYSGTVAAAIEGRFMGLPAIAISLVGKTHFSTAAKVLSKLLANIKSLPLGNDQIININVPDLPYQALKGIRITRCGARHRAETMTAQQDPFGKTIYWYGAIGDIADSGEGTDFDAIEQGYVSITPLTVDMTAYKSMSVLGQWIEDVVL